MEDDETARRPRTPASQGTNCPPTDSKRHLVCFVAGTPVWTEHGLVPIESIDLGTCVLGWNEATGEIGYYPVYELIRSRHDDLCELELAGGERIVCSRHHRF